MSHLYQRNKIYWIQYYDNGQRKQKSLKTKDKKIAKYRQSEINQRLYKGINPLPDTNLNPLKLLDLFKESTAHLKTKRTMRDDYKRIKDALTSFSPRQIANITEGKIMRYLNARLNDPEDKFGYTSANRLITNMKTFINWCVRENYCSSNPIQYLSKIKQQKKPPRFLSQAEIENILETARPLRIYYIIATAIYSGLRLGELRNLKWEDISFKENLITVHKSKSKNFRFVPLNKKLKCILSEIKKSKGKCLDFTDFRGQFEDVKNNSGIKDIRFHDLRHTFASRLVQEGVPIYTVSKYMGHGTIKMTEIYSHLVPDNEGYIDRI